MHSLLQSLCKRAQAGDQSAYNQLFAMHSDRARLFIRARLGRHLRSTVDSQDVLQDAFLAAHRQFDGFQCDTDEAFLKWLCRIIENRIRDWNDYQRAAKRQPVTLPTAVSTGLSTALDRSVERERLLKAIDGLSDDHRDVLLLKYFEGLSSEEIGQRLNRAGSAARKLLARALVELGRTIKTTIHPDALPELQR